MNSNVIYVQQVPWQPSSRPTNGHLADTYSVPVLRYTFIYRKTDRVPHYVINRAEGQCLLRANLIHLPLPTFIHADKHLSGDLL